MENRVITVMFIDMQGYTKRSANQTNEDLKIFHDEMKAFVSKCIESHKGILVKSLGDGFLIRFDSPTSAIQCGVEIQKKIETRNQNILDPEHLVRFRIGINTGEIGIDEEGDLFGDPVNIASRIQTFAEPNEVYISESTYLAMNRNEFGTMDLGPQSLKNATREIRIYKIIKSGSQGVTVKPPILQSKPEQAVESEKTADREHIYIGIAVVTGLLVSILLIRSFITKQSIPVSPAPPDTTQFAAIPEQQTDPVKTPFNLPEVNRPDNQELDQQKHAIPQKDPAPKPQGPQPFEHQPQPVQPDQPEPSGPQPFEQQQPFDVKIPIQQTGQQTTLSPAQSTNTAIAMLTLNPLEEDLNNPVFNNLPPDLMSSIREAQKLYENKKYSDLIELCNRSLWKGRPAIYDPVRLMIILHAQFEDKQFKEAFKTIEELKRTKIWLSNYWRFPKEIRDKISEKISVTEQAIIQRDAVSKNAEKEKIFMIIKKHIEYKTVEPLTLNPFEEDLSKPLFKKLPPDFVTKLSEAQKLHTEKKYSQIIEQCNLFLNTPDLPEDLTPIIHIMKLQAQLENKEIQDARVTVQKLKEETKNHPAPFLQKLNDKISGMMKQGNDLKSP